VRAISGFAIGGVPPYGWAGEPDATLIDEDLLAFDEICAAAGTPRSVFPLTPAELLEIRAGAPTLAGTDTGTFATRERMRAAERELAAQAEASHAHGLRPAGDGEEEGGRERDTGARIRALEGQGRAAGHRPPTPALRYVIGPRPPGA
jgi:hypothetical protein